MTKFYDARGNIYGVVSPQQVRDHGIGLPQSAVQAAQARESWATAAVHAFCAWAPDEAPPDAKAHRSDGLLIGPFQSEPPFDLLIVNTDGTLAERSGNGLTIFSQALQAQGLMPGAGSVCCRFITINPTACHRCKPRFVPLSSTAFKASGWTWANRCSGSRLLAPRRSRACCSTSAMSAVWRRFTS